MVFANAILILCGAALAQTLTPVEVTTTSKVDLGPGGTIHIVGSEGELNIEAWDRPEVEVTVRRYTERGPAAKDREAAQKTLEGIRVDAKKSGANEVTISTDVAGRNWLTRGTHGLTAMDIDYRIRAPRDAKLTIQHGAGDVVIDGIAGGIEARAKNGEISVFLPARTDYSIDAKAKYGTVYSDYDGTRKHVFPFGSSFVEKGSASAKAVILETANGGVTIQKSGE